MSVAPFELLIATFLVCLGSAVIPFLNTEIYLLGVSALAGPRALLAVVIAAAAGQMVGKAVLYFAGTGVLRLPARFARKVPALATRVASYPGGALGGVLLSSFSGVPPFYGISLIAGGLGLSFVPFLLTGFVGRVLRFAVVVALPQLAMGGAW